MRETARLRRRALRPLLLPLLGHARRGRRNRRVPRAPRRARAREHARSPRYRTAAPLRDERRDQPPRRGSAALLAAIEAEHRGKARISHLDGLLVEYPDWWFNLRPSNTEPVLRLNLESLVSEEDMEKRRDEVLGVIRG